MLLKYNPTPHDGNFCKLICNSNGLLPTCMYLARRSRSNKANATTDVFPQHKSVQFTLENSTCMYLARHCSNALPLNNHLPPQLLTKTTPLRGFLANNQHTTLYLKQTALAIKTHLHALGLPHRTQIQFFVAFHLHVSSMPPKSNKSNSTAGVFPQHKSVQFAPKKTTYIHQARHPKAHGFVQLATANFVLQHCTQKNLHFFCKNYLNLQNNVV